MPPLDRRHRGVCRSTELHQVSSDAGDLAEGGRSLFSVGRPWSPWKNIETDMYVN